jgi:hypothetical protein
MGTRNLTMVVKDGKFRVAQYCQWDGSPSGQGATVFDFIKNEMTPSFREQIDRTKILTNEEVHTRWKEYGADDSGMVNMDVANRFKVKNTHLDRDMGAKILSYIQSSPSPEVLMDLNFAADSLFCEWAYVIDLDHDVLEVYKGFNKTPLPSDERFKFLEETREPTRNGRPNKYYPIRLAAKYSFNSIKSDFKDSNEWAEHIEKETQNEE